MRHISKNHAILSDIDGTLQHEGTVPVTAERRALFLSLEQKLSGALGVITGRDEPWVENIFPGSIAGSFEFHAEWRGGRGDALNVRVPPKHLDQLIAAAETDLRGKVNFVPSPGALKYVANAVFMERKKNSFAMVFADAADDAMRARLIQTGKNVLKSQDGLKSLYDIRNSADAIEIGPGGTDKSHAVSDLMNSPLFKDRTPIYLGDSVPDEAAMKVVKSMGGFTIAVGGIIRDHAVVDRRVANVHEVWDVLKGWDAKLGL